MIMRVMIKREEITDIAKLLCRKYIKLWKQLNYIKLIQERRRTRFHRSYFQYPNKINIYESFSNITDMHIKLPRIDPSHLRILRIFTEYQSLTYEVNISTLQS